MTFSVPIRYPSILYPIGSMYGIYANIWGILMVNVTIYIYIAYMHPMGTLAQKKPSLCGTLVDLKETPVTLVKSRWIFGQHPVQNYVQLAHSVDYPIISPWCLVLYRIKSKYMRMSENRVYSQL